MAGERVPENDRHYTGVIMDLTDFLQTVPEFAGLTPSELDALEMSMSVSDYPDEYVFTKEGKGAHDIYLIIDGTVRVTHKKGIEGGVYELNRLGPGELFGLLALIDHHERSATCRAAGPVRAAKLPRSAFDLLYQSNAPIAYHFQKIVAHQMMKDFRSLIKAIRKSMHEGNVPDAVTDELIIKYSGPERRKTERRKGERRKAERRQ